MEQFPNGTKKETFGKRLNTIAEYLVSFTIKNGEPFDPTQIIDVSEDPDMVNILFED